ncbi:hypothetical protein KIN20_019343 [Parelaphostrongylus tenuis]|uniref:WHEP-TRS domain-containing protein n=1 Tax=Parelaphostrongylus tenuis TaxID=148309 RepID=A0AAD5QST9_PARTN|nr:hypothetical protein KIN20_019343 [Parelaphostrongylus tenuis]
MMEWDKIWSFNKKVIDPIAPRYTALESTSLVPVYISTPVVVEEVQVPLHPKNPDVGKKAIWRSAKLLVEQADALEMKSGDTVTFVNWGNINIVSIERSQDAVKQIHAVLDLANQDFKKTMKVTWIAETDSSVATCIPVIAADYDHIIDKAIIGKDEDWKHFINYDSVHFTKMLGEPALRDVKKGDIIQIQRKGFYICDHGYQEKTDYSGVELPLVLIYIPDGHVKESTNKGKQEKSGQACEIKQSLVADSSLPLHSSSDVASLYEEIQAQGELVRTEKAKDAKSEAAKAAIAKLLELKKQYKEKTGQEYKPGQTPVPNSSLPSQDTSSEALTLYQEIQAQGELVRTEKAKNAKSEAATAAIAKLLELKKLYKEKTGQEYKPGQAPVPNSSLPSQDTPSEALTLYQEIQAQGELVRTEKAKDAKSEAAKAAIARLLELKKLYKEKTGQEYKPDQAPVPSSSLPAQDASSEAMTLYKEIQAQGELVRAEKAKNAKSEEATAAIAKLLELKKLYKEKTGQEYKPGQAPVPNSSLPSQDASSEAMTLYKEIQAQGELVRAEKAKNAKSEEATAAIAKLLELKKLYKEKTGQEYKPGQAPSS